MPLMVLPKVSSHFAVVEYMQGVLSLSLSLFSETSFIACAGVQNYRRPRLPDLSKCGAITWYRVIHWI